LQPVNQTALSHPFYLPKEDFAGKRVAIRLTSIVTVRPLQPFLSDYTR